MKKYIDISIFSRKQRTKIKLIHNWMGIYIQTNNTNNISSSNIDSIYEQKKHICMGNWQKNKQWEMYGSKNQDILIKGWKVANNWKKKHNTF